MAQKTETEELAERISSLEIKIADLEAKEANQENQIVIIVFSQDLDKVLPSLIIAASAASINIKVKLFFTFWGVNAVKKVNTLSNKRITEKMMAVMSPGSYKKLTLSHLNMLGIGPELMKFMMKEHNITSQEDLMTICRESGVDFSVCEMSMNLMGITKSELIDDITCLGITSVVTEAMKSKFTLFI